MRMSLVYVLRMVRAAALVVGIVLLSAACSTANASSGSKTLEVVAAENFWGSLAAQLGGSHVHVTSLISKPNTDPHDYEPTPGDARAIASARLVIINGLGYDAWINRLLAANQSSRRRVLNVGDLVGLKDGANPHRWYSPVDVETVIGRITADYKTLDAADAASFDRLHSDFDDTALGQYRATLGKIKSKYGGTAVGASESVFSPLASVLDLKLLTPTSFLNAISEGNDPTAADKATVDRQIRTKQIKVFVFNSQNATPDVQQLIDAAKANGVVVVAVTETLTPEGATFQDWQTRQLQALEAALGSSS
jgi:zinc/manganese transport system substrate-binding protein